MPESFCRHHVFPLQALSAFGVFFGAIAAALQVYFLVAQNFTVTIKCVGLLGVDLASPLFCLPESSDLHILCETDLGKRDESQKSETKKIHGVAFIKRGWT